VGRGLTELALESCALVWGGPGSTIARAAGSHKDSGGSGDSGDSVGSGVSLGKGVYLLNFWFGRKGFAYSSSGSQKSERETELDRA